MKSYELKLRKTHVEALCPLLWHRGRVTCAAERKEEGPGEGVLWGHVLSHLGMARALLTLCDFVKVSP